MKILQQSINVPIDQVENWTENPRNIKPADLLRLITQIKDLGVYKPILCERIDGRLTVLGGNMRLRALREIGAQTVWLTEIETSGKAERVKISLSDNDRAGYYDLDDLAAQLKGLDINPTLYKVDLKAPIDDLGTVLDAAIEPEDKDDELPPAGPAVCRPGQIWALGKHRLLCGDATSEDHAAALMNGKKAALIFTDPPYNVAYSGRGKTTTRTILNDNQSAPDFIKFLSLAFCNYRDHSTPGSAAYVFHGDNTSSEFKEALAAAGYKIITPIIWVKKVASMGWQDYRKKHEPFFYCAKLDQTPEFYGNRDKTTTWDIELTDKELLIKIKSMIEKQEAGGSTVWRIGRETDYQHPTQKPVALILHAIKNSSKIGDLVVDFFGGSGSTLIAAEKLNRVCYCMELEPGFCDGIIRRWEKYTGNAAHLAGSLEAAK